VYDDEVSFMYPLLNANMTFKHKLYLNIYCQLFFLNGCQSMSLVKSNSSTLCNYFISSLFTPFSITDYQTKTVMDLHVANKTNGRSASGGQHVSRWVLILSTDILSY